MNLLSGVSEGALTNKRNSSADVNQHVIVRTTPGTLSITGAAAKGLSLADGERIVTSELPLSLADGTITVGGVAPTSNDVENSEPVIVMYKGITSNADLLGDEYKNANSDAGLTGEEKKAYNTALAAWVAAELEARGQEDNDHYGNRVRLQGGSYNFSSKAPWTYLHGTTDATRIFGVTQYVGIVVYADQTAELVKADFVADRDVLAYIVVSNTSNPSAQWAQADSIEGAAPFFVLSFESESAKTRGNVEGDVVEEGTLATENEGEVDDFVG